VLGHGDQEKFVRQAMSHQHGRFSAFNVSSGQRAAAHVCAHLRWHHHVEGEHRLEFLPARLLLEAVVEKCACRRDVGREVI
jgi:hypothetical protein